MAKSYSTRVGEKTTKTDAVKHVPVHPTLAAMLAEWKLGGWAAMMGRAPGPDDLIVPMPPDAAERRYKRKGATFITLAIDDGADPDVLETRVTHTRMTIRSPPETFGRRLNSTSGRWWRAAARKRARQKVDYSRISPMTPELPDESFLDMAEREFDVLYPDTFRALLRAWRGGSARVPPLPSARSGRFVTAREVLIELNAAIGAEEWGDDPVSWTPVLRCNSLLNELTLKVNRALIAIV